MIDPRVSPQTGVSGTLVGMLAVSPFLVLYLFVAPWVLADPASDAYSDDAWAPPEEVEITGADLAFSDEDYPSTKNEGVFFMTWFSDGWVLMVNLFRFDHVLFHQWGIYAVAAEPDGTEHWATLEWDARDVRFDADRLYVTDGVNVVEGGPDAYHVHLEIDGFSCDLQMRNILNAWQPGGGVYALDADGKSFQRRIVAAPWASVSGWIDIAGRRIVVAGQGYVEKSLIVNSFRRLNPILYSVRVYSPEETEPEDRWHLGLLDTTSHATYGSRRLPRLILARGEEWIMATTDYEVDPLKTVEGIDLPYVFPVSLRVSARSKGYVLEGVYTAERLFNVTDVMDEVPRWLRGILLLFMKRPVFFRFTGRFDGTVRDPDGTVHRLELYGPYEYVVAR